MKKIVVGVLLVILVLEPLLYVLDWAIAPHMFIRVLLTFGLAKVVADGLGKWVLRWPDHQWVYWRDYINNEFISKGEVLIFIAFLWAAINVMLGFSVKVSAPPWALYIARSSLVPAFLVISPKIRAQEIEHLSNRRLRSKL